MLAQILTLIIDTLGTLLVYVLLLRFHMQWLRAPFRNPVGELVSGLTNWCVLPARRVVPGLLGLDIATLVLAWLVQMLVQGILMSLRGYDFGGAPGIAFVVMGALAAVELMRMSVILLIAAAIIQALLSFVAPYSPMAPVLDAITRPFYKPFRRFIPPVGNIDLSPLALILAAQVALIMLAQLRAFVASPF